MSFSYHFAIFSSRTLNTIDYMNAEVNTCLGA